MSSETQITEPCGRKRWPFLSRRVVLSALMLLGLMAVVIWRQTADSADIGEPFDVQSVASISIPDDQNAFTYYRRAAQRFVNEPMKMSVDSSPHLLLSANDQEVLEQGFESANDDCRKWLEANRQALDLWRRGSECSQAIEIKPEELGLLKLPETSPPLDLSRLALLEAARLTAKGSPAQAWEWYRATLRCGRHLGMHAGGIGRLVGKLIHDQSEPAILRWSADARLSADDLRRALTDTLAADEMTPPPSETVKFEYLSTCARLKDRFARPSLPDRLRGFPHRLEKAVKLITANWLSQVDRPRYRRTPVVEVGNWELFELDASTPRDAHVCSPAEIDMWCGLSRRAIQDGTQGLLMSGVTIFLQAVDRERTRQAALVLGLALELYHRERGQFPAALQELVEQKYLPSIPVDPFGKGEQFHYRRKVDPKDGVDLWSVWIDGIDQHGTSAAGPEAPGDKVFRISRPR